MSLALLLLALDFLHYVPIFSALAGAWGINVKMHEVRAAIEFSLGFDSLL